MTDTPCTVYSSESPLRHPTRVFRGMIRDLVRSRELAWRLFARDVRATYRQSALGYAWAFLPSIVTTLTFTYLNSQDIIRIQPTPIPYPAYVMTGMVLWQTFLDALNSPLRSVAQSRGILTRINFPHEALILSALAEVIFNLLIRMALLVPMFVYFGLPVHSSAVLAPLGALALALLGLACGLLITPLGMLYGDVGRAVTVLAGFWMFLTPVVYPPPRGGLGAALVNVNPVSPLMQTTRDWLIGQPVEHLAPFLFVTAMAFGALLLAWLVYRLSMPILIERMGA